MPIPSHLSLPVAMIFFSIFAVVLFGIPVTNDPRHVVMGAQEKCSNGWYITGYFTPHESDYNGSKQTLGVIGQSSTPQNRSFYRSFLNDVETEGWGKTLQGDYVGFVSSDKQWRSSPKPINGVDQPLLPHTVAVDPKLIKMTHQLKIPSLPYPWNVTTFTAADVGPDIKGKHIDVYTGEGLNAGKETFRLTGHHNQVCLI